MDDMVTKNQSPRSVRFGAIVGGVILLALGTTLLLDHSGVMWFHTAPLVLIIIGVAMLAEGAAPKRDVDGEVQSPSCQRSNSTGGLWLIGIGAWMFVSQSHLWGLSFETSWPLFLVLMGFMMVIRGGR